MWSGRPIDLVYTWVDGSWPGYAALLAEHARRPVDLNPNRYRDNLDLLRYSLRSVARHLPWVRTVYLVTARPQVPAWIEPGAIRIVHHDELAPADALPTFSSFSIVSRLAGLPDLSERFLYVEDDRLFLSDLTPADFVDEAERLKLYAHGEATPPGTTRDRSASPWDAALAETNACLDERYGVSPRPSLKRAPLFVDRGWWARLEERFAPALARTRANKFRDPGSIAPEHLYPYFLWHEGAARFVERRRARAMLGYVGLDNLPFHNALRLRGVAARRPAMLCLNDNFGPAPRGYALRPVRAFLEAMLPTPSRFERRASEAAS